MIGKMGLNNFCSCSTWRFLTIVFVAQFSFHGLSYAEKAPNFSFILEATRAPPVSHYDYIIIGGGTAGCPLAATLSTGNVRVLVLERGGSPYVNTTKIRIENFISTLTDNSPATYAQPFVSEGVFNRRAKVLGGGTVINGGFYSRAESFFLKQMGLDEALANDSYRWVEDKIVYRPVLKQWASAVRNGLLEAGVLPDNGFTYDHINGTKTGGTILDSNGERHTAADLFEYANPRFIEVYFHAVVQKITFTPRVGSRRPKATGVIFLDANGRRHTAYLENSRGEIIVSAGTIGSPQLLMLSGIGNSTSLQKLGISVVLDQPMVGKDVADNPSNGLVIPSPRDVEISLVVNVGITVFSSYIESLSGFNLLGGSIRRNGSLSNNQTGNSSATNLGSIVAKIAGPISKGYLELRNTNASDNPIVRFNYYQDAEDLRRCVQGVQTVFKVVNSTAFSSFRFQNMTIEDLIKLRLANPGNLRPQNLNSTTSLEQFCIDTVTTQWHYHGGCEIGKIVDRNFKVLGVDSLRVIDASTFNFSPGSNPMATILMLGRYMGRTILQGRRR